MTTAKIHLVNQLCKWIFKKRLSPTFFTKQKKCSAKPGMMIKRHRCSWVLTIELVFCILLCPRAFVLCLVQRLGGNPKQNTEFYNLKLPSSIPNIVSDQICTCKSGSLFKQCCLDVLIWIITSLWIFKMQSALVNEPADAAKNYGCRLMVTTYHYEYELHMLKCFEEYTIELLS